MNDAIPAPHLPPRSYSRRCRYRVEQLDADHFAVVERNSNHIIIAGFTDYSAAWSFIATRLLDARRA